MDEEEESKRRRKRKRRIEDDRDYGEVEEQFGPQDEIQVTVNYLKFKIKFLKHSRLLDIVSLAVYTSVDHPFI